MNKLNNLHLLLGVTGGISIYKVVDLANRLYKVGVSLEIVMTESAKNFVSPLTFETIGRCIVYSDMFHEGHHSEVEHIQLAQRAELLLIAPATANTIAKIASGLADSLLTSVALAYDKPIIFAPAMNTNMLNNRNTQQNIDKLKSQGHHFISTKTGKLACNVFGDGKMAEPDEIIDYLEEYLTVKDLRSKKILVTAGPTIERIDPVRYLTNDSSGKMGYAIAKQAMRRGASVRLVTGPTSQPVPRNIHLHPVQTTGEMLEKVLDLFDCCDALIMAAAPCDYKPLQAAEKKIKKTGQTLEMDLIENPDILKSVGKKKKEQVIIGFAAETDELIQNAKNKLIAKNMDYIVANDITQEGAGFNVDTNIATILSRTESKSLPKMDKTELADIILDLLL